MLRHPQKLNKQGALTAQKDSLSALHREWLLYTSVAAATVLLSGWLLSVIWSTLFALRWTALASIVIALQSYILCRSLHKNHRPGEAEILPTLGIGNILSLCRGLYLAWIAGFLFSPWPDGWLAWLPAILYIAVALIDLADGYAARVTNHMTALGEALDMELDTLGILIAPLLGVWYGQLPLWYLLASGARYFFLAGMWWRNQSGKPNHDLLHSDLRRILAGFQMGFIGFILLPLFSPPATWIAAAGFLLPFAVVFLRDWLIVSGTFDPLSERYKAAAGRADWALLQVLPVVLRILIFILCLWIAVPYFGRDSLGESALGTLLTLLGALIAGGIGARTLSAVLLLVIGVTLPVNLPGSLLIVSASLTFLLGSGKFSIWRPEETLLRGRFGEKSDLDYDRLQRASL